MIYLFLGIPRQSYNLRDLNRQQFRIKADNFSQANRTVRQQHARDFVLLNIGRISAQAFTKNNVNQPACPVCPNLGIPLLSTPRPPFAMGVANA